MQPRPTTEPTPAPFRAMQRGDVLSGTAFGTALRASLVSLVVLFSAGAGVLWLVHKSMEGEIRDRLAEETELFRQIYLDEGRDGLANVIETLRRLPSSSERLLGLFGPDGAHLAGGIDVAPDFVGVRRLRDPAFRRGSEMLLSATDHAMDGHVLVVGRTFDRVHDMERSFALVLGAGGALGGLVSLAIGFAASRSTYRRLDAMNVTLRALAEGGNGRLPVGDRNDQFDRLSRTMNVQLDRLSHMMAITRDAGAALAHELRTPLNRASIALQDIDPGVAGPAEVCEGLARVERELATVDRLFDAIVRLARLRAGTAASSFESLALGTLVEEVSAIYEDVVEESGRTLAAEIATGGDLRVRADANMLRQLLSNLIENAIRYTPEGTHIVLSAGEKDGLAGLAVADDGPGIPEARRAEAMRVFGQLDRHGRMDGALAHGRPQGFGLGLALCAAIAEHHGGHMDLESNDPGLRVTVTLPLEGNSSD